MPQKGPGYSGRNLQEPSVTEFKLHIGPSGGIEVGYFLLGASLAKLAMIKRCTNPSFIAISILNCAEYLLDVDLQRESSAGCWKELLTCVSPFIWSR